MIKYPIKISRDTKVLLRPPEKEGECFFSLPAIHILNRHLILSCIISEDSPVPDKILKCRQIFKYKKRIRFLSKEYFRMKRILSDEKFDIFIDMNLQPMPIIGKISRSEISVSYVYTKGFNLIVNYSQDIDYMKKFLLITGLLNIKDKRVNWEIKPKFKWNKKEQNSIGYYFKNERLNKMIKGIEAFKIQGIKELSSISLFITDMNNFLPYAYIGNVPIIYIKTPDELNLPEREDIRTVSSKVNLQFFIDKNK